MMADVKWIKVYTSMFESNRKIKQIELMPEGDTILVIWLKLLLLAGNVNDRGAIYITPEVPYTDEMLANELRRPLTTVRMALSVFEMFGMIENIDNVLYLSSWEKYQNTDKLEEMREQNRKRVAKHREKQKALALNGDQVCNVTDRYNVTLRNALEEEKEKDLDLDLEKEGGVVSAASPAPKLEKFGGILGKGVLMLTEEQVNDLLDRLSLDEFDLYCEKLSNYIIENPDKTFKSHYRTILKWVSEDRTVKGVV